MIVYSCNDGVTKVGCYFKIVEKFYIEHQSIMLGSPVIKKTQLTESTGQSLKKELTQYDRNVRALQGDVERLLELKTAMDAVILCYIDDNEALYGRRARKIKKMEPEVKSLLDKL